MKYTIKQIVCDYGVICVDTGEGVCICNKKRNAELIADILNGDADNSCAYSYTPQQRTGRWIPTGYDGYADGNPVYDWWECSECGWEHTGDEKSLTAFCPNCGTKMEVI